MAPLFDIAVSCACGIAIGASVALIVKREIMAHQAMTKRLKDTSIVAEFKPRGADYVAAIRLHDYRTQRTD